MFERYTEQARRAIFYARYEASQLSSDYIEPVHLMLGLLREDSLLRRMLSIGEGELIRAEVEQSAKPGPKIATSVDMPLSHPAKRALDRAKDAADELGSKPIDTGHLLLGLLKIDEPPVPEILARHGIDSEKVTAKLRNPPPPAVRMPPMVRNDAALEQISDDAARQRLTRLPWTRKEALGHLIDWAAAHHEWIGRALVEPKVVAHGYPIEERVEAARYNEMLWTDLVIAWLALNDLVGQIAAQVPPERLQIPCRIGIDSEKPLAQVIARYNEYTGDILAQICSAGDMLP
jgi:hypothetical protein